MNREGQTFWIFLLLDNYAPMAYIQEMVFIETSIFTKEVKRLIKDDEYKQLQSVILLRPEAGALIKGSGGLRKVRWKLRGEGKRGGLRVIYYFDPPDTVYMLLAYKKREQEDLTNKQIKFLCKLMKEWLS